MKTTKKGFTLIELIVVIAIIGVLAAILVPSMLGYVRKSKITSANSAAAEVQKAITNALTDADSRGVKCTATGWVKLDNGSFAEDDDAPKSVTKIEKLTDLDTAIAEDVKGYMDKISKIEGIAYINKVACTAVVCTTDGNYVGSYPAGYVDPKDYKKKYASYSTQDVIAEIANTIANDGDLSGDVGDKAMDGSAATLTKSGS